METEQNLRLGLLIRQILLSKDRVYIPGFGTLLRTYQAARMDIDTNKMLPPQLFFEIDRSAQYDDPYLAESFAHQMQIPFYQANNQVHQFGQKLSQDLAVKGAAFIPEIGDLHRVGRDFSMTPVANLLYGAEWPTISMENLWGNRPSQQTLMWEFSAFAGMLILVLAVVYYWVHGSRSAHNDSLMNRPALIGELHRPDSLEFLEEFDSREDNTAPIGYTEDPEQSDRVIIVGVFSSTQNLGNMREELLSRGWNVYQEPIGEQLTRIGTRPTSSQTIDELLGIVKNELEPEAWILVKE